MVEPEPETAIDRDRPARLARLLAVLTEAGGTARAIGSLGAGTADDLSDLDVRWDAGAAASAALARLPETLARVGEVESLRLDPDADGAAERRLVFVRFAGWPLLSRVDLELRGELADAPAPTWSREWSPVESALMNVLGAAKARRRGRHPSEVDGLLARGFARLGAADPGAGIAPLERMRTLADAAAVADAAHAPLAARVRAAAEELLSSPPRPPAE